eukprot:jgi/Mesvir1/28874/Mv25721-RA.1
MRVSTSSAVSGSQLPNMQLEAVAERDLRPVEQARQRWFTGCPDHHRLSLDTNLQPHRPRLQAQAVQPGLNVLGALDEGGIIRINQVGKAVPRSNPAVLFHVKDVQAWLEPLNSSKARTCLAHDVIHDNNEQVWGQDTTLPHPVVKGEWWSGAFRSPHYCL